jgi:ArsR family transcriptional regulator
MKKLRVLEQPCCAPGAPPLPKRSAEALADRFKALSDPARVAIINQLAGRGEVCTCNLTGFLGLSQPTVSHHLRVLREAGLVEIASKRGTFTFYSSPANAPSPGKARRSQRQIGRMAHCAPPLR